MQFDLFEDSVDENVKHKSFKLEDRVGDVSLKSVIISIDKQHQLKEVNNYINRVKSPKVISIDIETRGLNPLEDDIIMFQVGDLDVQFVIDTRRVDISTTISAINEKESLLEIVGQNLKFEYKFIKHNFNYRIKKIFDTMIAEKVLKNGETYRGMPLSMSLKAISERRLNYVADKTIRENFLTIGDKPFSEEEITYGAYDLILPLMIRKLQISELKKENKVKLVSDIEFPMVQVLGDMELRGMHFDKAKWLALYDQNFVELTNYRDKLNQYLIDQEFTNYYKKQYNIYGELEHLFLLKWTSSKQVIVLLKSLNLCPTVWDKKTKKEKPTVEAGVLELFIQKNKDKIKEKDLEMLRNYLVFSKFNKKCTTYGSDFFKHINKKTGRIHSSYTQIINTGRMSSSGPNLQNIPGDKRFRECFTSPKGSKIVNADYSSQENVVLANRALDEDLLSFYDSGESDMHSFIASKIWPDKMAGLKLSEIKKKFPEDRGIAKAAGFAINYGGNGSTIAKNLGVADSIGTFVYDSYFKAFPGLRKYFDEQISLTLKRGHILINEDYGRTLKLNEAFSRMNEAKSLGKTKTFLTNKGIIERKALNAPVQGTAGDMTKLAAVMFNDWIYKNDMSEKMFITNLIHDEINVESLEKYANLAAEKLQYFMEKAGSVWCKRVPIKAEAVIKDYWTH